MVQSDRSFMEVVRGEKKQEEVVQIRQALVDGKGKSEAEETVVLPTDLKNQRQSQINKIASMGKTGNKPLPTAVGAGVGGVQLNMAIVNEGAKISVVINKRFLLSFSNSNDSGEKRDLKSSHWSRRDLIVEVIERK